MSYTIALNFEDGVTRFIDCNENEKVLDAAFRNRINLPMDCFDGVCGTCICHCEQGEYDLGDEYLEDALSEIEVKRGMVLTCQMIPSSDCIINVPVSSIACKTTVPETKLTVTGITSFNDAAFELVVETDKKGPLLSFLPGQYVNLQVPGTDQHRSYSFSSAPNDNELRFLIKHVPKGLMSEWLAIAQVGDILDSKGPLGSFYLRTVERPLLMLAGGTGLAPILSILEVLAQQECTQPIHLIYGVTTDLDLVLVDRLEAYTLRFAQFSFNTCVADPNSSHSQTGYVTQHLPAEVLHDGDVDVYLCGPPAMVDAVDLYFEKSNIKPENFHYEKFTPNVIGSSPTDTRQAI